MNDTVDCSNIPTILPSIITNKHVRKAYMALQKECFLLDDYEISLTVAYRIIQRELGVTKLTAKRHINDLSHVYKLLKPSDAPSRIVVTSYPEIMRKYINDVKLVHDLKKGGYELYE